MTWAWAIAGDHLLLDPSDDLEGQVRCLASGAALVHRRTRASLEVTGRDAADFLQRMLSQDLRGLAPGRAVRSCVLTPRGRILGDPVVWRFPDRFLLDLEAEAVAPVRAHLERHAVAEDLTFHDRTAGSARLLLAGPRAADLLAALGAGDPRCAVSPSTSPSTPPGAHRPLPAPIGPGHALRMNLGRVPAIELLVPSREAGPLLEALVARPEVGAAGEEAFAVLRVREGIPAWGAEIGPDVMPLEVGLGEVAVSLSKGCYPGHEPVAKARHRGRPPNLLVRLALDASRPPARGTGLREGGRPVGRLTTVVRDPAGGDVRALGLVRAASAEAGRSLEVDGGGGAVVVGEGEEAPRRRGGETPGSPAR